MTDWLRAGREAGKVIKQKRLSRLPQPDLNQAADDLSVPVVAHFGGGANSTAYLIEWIRRGLRLDLVLFSDTGG